MHVLFCHHLEPIWNDGLKRHGTDFHSLCEEVAEHILENNYDAIIITQFEMNDMDRTHEAYFPIFAVCEEKGINIEWQEYGYGWELDSFSFEDEDAAQELLESGEIFLDQYGTKLVRGGNHSQVVLIEDWIEYLAKHDVSLCGAFDGECLEDISIAFDAANVNFFRIESLII